MSILILYLTIAILVSFLCSILEAVLLSVTPTYVTVKLQEGKSWAKRLEQYKENIDRPLAAILTLNTFAHTIGAAGVGAQAQIIWGDESLTATSAILTILILVLSEIIPKTIGANYWKNLTGFMVNTLRVMLFILYPFVVVSQMITRFLSKNKIRGVLSRTEFMAMAEAGAREGVIRKHESRIIQNIARFDKIQTKDIMTPRTVVFGAHENTQIQEFYKDHPEIRFSRIPLYGKSMDNITGFVLKDELLAEMINNHGKRPLKTLRRDIPVVYEGLPIPSLYNLLIGENEHIALVVDEYGGTAGVVTIEDVIETLLGMEIVDEMDNIEDLQKTARERWSERARRMGIDIDEKQE
ncbi:MAG: hemolysin family protein [Bacteroidales bacterium]|nr:hemolysin family protein [Bacteroidales bacterium]MCF8350929.1 hemolysin family protein [Bacteroidales bacterium]MCF8377408.1 hemolysin family protein [Bacteroidales bacterium]MCF8401443.1 hemolysin family protein [Bacteroidales bacterium]